MRMGPMRKKAKITLKEIYGKRQASIRFICSLFSLPIPPQSANCTKEELASVSTQFFLECLEQHRAHKLLLLGLEGSGTSTIYKQAKLIYANKFTAEELQEIKLTIQRNMYRYLSTLLEWREQFEEEALTEKESADLATDRSVTGEIEYDGNRRCIYSVNQKINNFSDWLLGLVATGDIDTFFPAAAREYAPLIEGILKDTAIQETYKRIRELQFLPDVARYFLDRVMEISSNEYEPSEKDILFAEDITTPRNGLACTEFSFDDHSATSQIFNEDSKSQHPLPKYQLIHLRSNWPQYGFKWLEMFEGTNAVVFCVSLTDYDQLRTHGGGPQNKMLESRDFFESVARSSCFEDTPFLLLLTKYDLFADKINRVPLTVCEWFGDFDPCKAHNKSLSVANQAFHCVAAKFKDLYCSITGRKLYVSQIQCWERKSVDEVFRYVREIIAWEEQKDAGIYATSDEDSVCGVGTNSCPL